MSYKDRKRVKKNDYIVVEDSDNPKSFDTGTGIVGVYEHRLIAEEMMGRELKEDEVVHHLDENKGNNSPDNLLVLENSQHVKLHQWMSKNTITPKPSQVIRNHSGCVRCQECDKPVHYTQKFCSHQCHIDYKKSVVLSDERNDVENIQELVNNHPLTTVGSILGISDNGVRQRCKSLGVEIPKREPGYWTKKRLGLVD